MLRAFRHRNFRLYFGGQSISLIGTWIQQIALGWTIYQLTHSSWLLGLVSFAGQLPLFILTPFAGVLVDRWSRHRTLIITQSLSMLQAFLLAIVVSTHLLQVWNLILLNVLAGIILAVDLPARQTFIVEMVGSGHDLPNAVALNSLVINGGRMLGPAIAGLLLTLVTPAVCFYLNAVSYIPVVAALCAMRVKETPDDTPHGGHIDDLLQGVRYAIGFPPIRAVLIIVSVVSLVGLPYAVLMPIFAAEVLHGGAHTTPDCSRAAAGVVLAPLLRNGLPGYTQEHLWSRDSRDCRRDDFWRRADLRRPGAESSRRLDRSRPCRPRHDRATRHRQYGAANHCRR